MSNKCLPICVTGSPGRFSSYLLNRKKNLRNNVINYNCECLWLRTMFKLARSVKNKRITETLSYRLYSNVSFRANQLFIACLYLFRKAYAYLNFRSPKHDKNNKMSQQMNVLCCFSCNMYQVHIVKKSNKWQCKICGNKQSIQIVYFQGSGSDCRKQVQHLNYLKSTKERHQPFNSVTIDEYGLDCVSDETDEIGPCNCPSRAKRSAGKWSKYLDIEEEDDSDSETSGGKENCFASQDNIQRCRKWWKKERRSYSLPPTQNSSKIECESDKRSYETKAGTSRSRTHPPAENSSRIPNKWDKFLNQEMETSNSNTKVNQSEIVDEVTTPANTPSKNHIFDDLDDDLDVDIDF